jgi:hypothetical protein
MRYKKVYSLYGMENNLRSAQGKGLLRVQETMGDCYSLGTVQRRPLYYILNEWFDIPLPSAADMDIELDSWLSFGGIRTDLDIVRYKESLRRMPDSALLSITPQTDAHIKRKALHELAYDNAQNQLREARNELSKLTPAERRNRLSVSLSEALGGLDTVSRPKAKLQWEKSLTGAVMEGFYGIRLTHK